MPTQTLHRSLQQNPDRPATIHRDRVTVSDSALAPLFHPISCWCRTCFNGARRRRARRRCGWEERVRVEFLAARTMSRAVRPQTRTFAVSAGAR